MGGKKIRRNLIRIRSILLAAVGTVALPMQHRAMAIVPDSWIATSGGNWSDGTKWSANSPPGATDASITNAFSGTQTITYDYTGSPVSLNSFTVGSSSSAGTDTFVMAANNLTVAGTGGETVGIIGDVVNFNQSGGVNKVVGNGFYLAGGFGSAYYTLSGTATLNASNSFEAIGYNGYGNFNQSGGTNSVTAVPGLSLGSKPGSTGVYTFSAGSLSSNNEYIGNAGGGTFNQSGGTNLLNSTTTIYVGYSAGATGTYALSGGLLTNAAEVVGYLGYGNFNQSGGTNNSYDMQVGDVASGSYLLSGGNLTAVQGENIGLSGTGDFTQTGGTNTLTGIALEIGVLPGGTGTYTLTNGSLSAPNDIVGSNQHSVGNFNQTGGTNTITDPGGIGLILGFVGGTGTYTLSAGNLNSAGEIIGYTSAGTFNQSAGTNTLSGPATNLTIGSQAGATGSYTLTGGALSVGGTTAVGGTTNAAGGVGNLTLVAPAHFTSASLVVWKQGLVKLSGFDTALKAIQIDPAGGLIDVTNGSFTINYGVTSPNAAVRNYISSSYNVSGTPWSGITGITSSNAHADPIHRSVAFADGSDGVVTNLPANISTAIPGGGVLPSGTELVTYTFAGDANLDGKVDFSDFVILSNHFGGTFTNWDQGNFNYDPHVDFSDFVILSNNFGEGVTSNGVGATPEELARYNALAASLGISESQITSWDRQIAALPEPAALTMLVIGGLGLMQRRRRI